MESRLKSGATFAENLKDDEDSFQLFCLPIVNQDEVLGKLTLITGCNLDMHERRHLQLAVDAIIPVLETFLLRSKIFKLNHNLGLAAKYSFQAMERINHRAGETEARLETLIETSGNLCSSWTNRGAS
jgi:hypothetical protein